jgi:two-component system, cell cycle sensor histidine kinase and response regulator CckA
MIQTSETETDLSCLQAAVERAVECVIIADSHEIVKYVNTSFEHVSGYTRIQVLGKPLKSIHNQAQAKELQPVINKALQKADIWEGEFVSMRADGKEYREQGNISAIRDNQGNLTHYVVLKRDITHELELEQNLRYAHKIETVGQLARGIAHDYNNMLGVILVHSDLILKKLGQEDPLRKKLEAIRKAGQRAAQITQHLLFLSRRQPYNPQVIDLQAHLEQDGEMIRRLMTQHIESVAIVGRTEAKVHIDPSCLAQTITSLVLHTCEKIPKDGKLTIHLSDVQLKGGKLGVHPEALPGVHAKILIENTKGSATDQDSSDFQPFIPAKKTSKRALITAYETIRQSDGWLELRNKDGMSEAWAIYLPFVIPSTPTQLKSAVLLGSEKILIVEDDELMLQMAQELLKELGYSVISAHNAEEALKNLESGEQIDLLFTDTVMPGVNGIELAKRFKNRSPQTKILLTSGYSERSKELSSMDSSFTFIPKPYDLNTLSQKLRELLDKK